MFCVEVEFASFFLIMVDRAAKKTLLLCCLIAVLMWRKPETMAGHRFLLQQRYVGFPKRIFQNIFTTLLRFKK